MTARIINLRRARKHKARDEKRAQADQNAIDHGRNAQDITLAERRADRDRRHLDGHRLSPPDEEDD